MSRARKAEKSELNKILKEITRRMSDFEESVQKFSELKECAEEIDESIAQQAAINKNRLDTLNKEFQDNKIRAINNAAEELGKTLITKEELNELRTELQKVKEMGRQEVEKNIIEIQKRFDEKLVQALNMKKLEHDAESAKLRAEVDSHIKEMTNLNNALDRMSEELKSQKQLTASVVAPRSNQTERT